jgi:hypothetical protein
MTTQTGLLVKEQRTRENARGMHVAATVAAQNAGGFLVNARKMNEISGAFFFQRLHFSKRREVPRTERAPFPKEPGRTAHPVPFKGSQKRQPFPANGIDCIIL